MAIFGTIPVQTAVSPLYKEKNPSRRMIRFAVPNGPRDASTTFGGLGLSAFELACSMVDFHFGSATLVDRDRRPIEIPGSIKELLARTA